MKTIIIKSLKKIYLASIVLLMLVALLFSIVRAMTPWVAKHKHDIESWVSQQLHMPVTINEIQATWYGFSPVVELDDIAILQADAKQPVLEVKKLYVGVDLFKSLKHWKLALGKITVSGVALSLEQQAKGNWTVKGLEQLSSSSTGQSSKQQLWHQLIQQPQISLRDVNLQLIPKKGRIIHLKQMHLLWQSQGQFHRLTGEALVHKQQTTQVRFLLQIVDDKIGKNQLQATIYVHIKDLLLSSWLKDIMWQGLTIDSGVADVDIMGKIRKSRIYAAQMKFDAKDLIIQDKDEKPIQQMEHGKGQIRWDRLSKSDWTLQAEHLQWKINNEKLPEQSFNIHYQHDDGQHHITAQAKAITIAPIAKIIDKSSLLNQQRQQWLATLQPRGLIQDVTMQFAYQDDQIKDIQLQSHFENVSINKSKDLPGFTQLSGTVRLDKQQGQLLLDSKNGSVNVQPLFRTELPFEQLLAHIHWQKQQQQWLVKIPKMHYQVDDIQLDAEVTLSQLGRGKLPIIDSIAAIKAKQATQEQISRYLPVTLIPKPAVQWLDEAFHRVGSADVKAILRGPLAQFPFDKDQGKFIVEGQFKDAILHYQDGWPMANNISGTLQWRVRGFNVMLDTVTLDQLQLQQVHATIPYIGTEEGVILHVQGKTHTDIAKPINYIKKTPLVHLFDDKIKQLSGAGNVDLALELAIPINDNKQPDIRYQGEVTFDNTKINMAEPAVNMDHLQGTVRFSEKTLEGKALTAELFSNPATINISMQSHYPKIAIQGKANISDIEKMLSFPSHQLLSGSSAFDVLIIPNVDGIRLTVESDLQGLVSQLPAPLTKNKTQVMPSSLSVTVDKNNNLNLQFQLNNYISGALQYVSEKQQWTSGKIHFGEEPTDFQTKPGLVIDGKTPQFDWDKWQSVFKQFSHSQSPVDDYHLREVHIAVPKFNIFGQTINNADLGLRFVDEGWEINIHSDEIIGVIDLPKDYTNKTVIVNLDRLHLNQQLPTNTPAAAFNFAKSPNISAHIKDFAYQDKQLGAISVTLLRKPNGIEIANLTVHSSAFKMQLGGFLMMDKQPSVAIKGTIHSDDTEKALKQWGLPGHLDSADAQLGFDLSWPGSIADFSLPDTQGYISARVNKGRITGLGKDTDVKLGLGRLITILSLQSLPKRLQLNFKDLTRKGYFFDKMRGDFSLESGNVVTKNAYLQGPVAQVNLSGLINMFEQNYDLTLKVQPNLTSSLPVVATIAGGPVAGAVTWAADKLVGKQVNKITQNTYHITGPWKEPNIEQVKHYAHEVTRQ